VQKSLTGKAAVSCFWGMDGAMVHTNRDDQTVRYHPASLFFAKCHQNGGAARAAAACLPGGTPANRSSVEAHLLVTVGVASRVVVVTIDGYVFVYLHCVPIIIIDDPAAR
jgi:hypothetical protein